MLISGAWIQGDRKGPARPLLDQALREPACQVFQDAVMVIQLALQLQAAILDGGLLLVEFPLDLQQQVLLIAFAVRLLAIMPVAPNDIKDDQQRKPRWLSRGRSHHSSCTSDIRLP